MVDELLSDLDFLLSSGFVNRNLLIGYGVREAKNKLKTSYLSITQSMARASKPQNHFTFPWCLIHDTSYKHSTKSCFWEYKIDSIKNYFYYVYSQYSCQFGSHMNQNPVKPTRASFPGRGRFHVKKQDALENLEHEIKRYLKEILEYDLMVWTRLLSIKLGKYHLPLTTLRTTKKKLTFR